MSFKNNKIFPKQNTWYFTDWQKYCSFIEDKYKNELISILENAFRIKPSMKESFLKFTKGKSINDEKVTKKMLCNFLALHVPKKLFIKSYNKTNEQEQFFENFTETEKIWSKEKFDENDLLSVYENEKLLIAKKISKDPSLLPIPFKKIESMEEKELIKKYKEIFPDIKQKLKNKPKLEVLIELYRLLSDDYLNQIVLYEVDEIDPLAFYKEAKLSIAKKIAEDPSLLPIPFKKIESMEEKELIKKYKVIFPDIEEKLNTKSKPEVLIELYKLLSDYLNQNILDNIEEPPDIKDIDFNNKEKLLKIIKKYKNKNFINDLFRNIPKNNFEDKNFYLQVLDIIPYTNYIKIPKNLRNDKEVAIKIFQKYKYIYESPLKLFSKELRNDKDVVLEAVKNNGLALEFASDKLKKDKDVVLATVKNDGYALQYASEDLRKDKDVVLEAVKNDGYALQYAHNEFKNDKKVVLAAVKNNGWALQYASDKLKDDKEVVLEAYKNNKYSVKFASKFFQNMLFK